MIKRLMAIAATLLAGHAAAASAVVWTNEDGVSATKAPAYRYTFTYGTGASVDTANVDGALDIEFTAPATTTSAGAGVGFGWEQDSKYNDVAVTLAAYKGACITYKAEYPFRVDFKQSTITDENYYGAELAASSAYKSTFVAFADLTQGWKSTTTVAWAVAKQTGAQFSYKNTHAKSSGSTTNSVEITKFVLADECPAFAPTLLGDEEVNMTLNEGDTLKLDIATIFEDKDGDATVTATMLSGKANASIVGSAKSYALDGVVKVVPAANTNGSSILVLEAADAKDTVSFTVNITVVDRENAPVAVNDSYSVNEDETLKVKVTASILLNDYDVDNANENLTIALVDSTVHGLLTLDTTGAFTYVPEADFNGEDSFTYTVTDSTGLTSDAGTVTITVKPVNDPLTLVVVDEDFFKDTVMLAEDFDAESLDPIAINSTILKFDDADGISSLTIGAKSSNGIVNAEVTVVKSTYYIELSPVENANGLDSIVFFAKDSEDSVGVMIYVDVTPVADNPVAVADTYTAYEDSLLTVTAKKGVLANDYNPDDSTVALSAVLGENASHGVVELDSNGSFTYMPEADYYGKDSFTYCVVSADGLVSDTVIVTLNVQDMNESPVVAIDSASLDTTIKEDSGILLYSIKTVATWFTDPDGDDLTYTFKSLDDKMTVKASANSVTLSAVRDSNGVAVVTVEATDGISKPVTFNINIDITPVNDAPKVLKRDTVKIDSMNWEVAIDLSEIFRDPDGDSLTYRLVTVPGIFDATLDDGVVTVVPHNDTLDLTGKTYKVMVRAYDATDSAVTTILFEFGLGTDAIAPSIANANMNWQGAIQGNRGSVTLMDMQGRVMWTRRLPVSESEVRNASASVQGRKILRVNSQTWTIR